jgi:hypothetical protein
MHKRLYLVLGVFRIQNEGLYLELLKKHLQSVSLDDIISIDDSFVVKYVELEHSE